MFSPGDLCCFALLCCKLIISKVDGVCEAVQQKITRNPLKLINSMPLLASLQSPCHQQMIKEEEQETFSFTYPRSEKVLR